jgi:hypothetical protein
MSNINFIVKTTTHVRSAGSVFAGFNKVCLLVDDSVITTAERFRVYSNIDDLKNDFDDTTIEYKKSAYFFDQETQPNEIYLLAVSSSEDVADAYKDFVAKNGGAYFITTTSTNEDVIKDIAAKVELLSSRVHFIFRSTSADILDNSKDTDIASFMSNKEYRRTTALYTDDENEYVDMKLAGRVYSINEGASWENRVMKGTKSTNVSSTNVIALEAKDCGFFVDINGETWSQNIKSSNGWFADINRGIDYIDKAIDERIINMARDTDLPKDNVTMAKIKAILLEVIASEGVKRAIVDKPTMILNVPDASELNAGRDIVLDNLYSFDYLHSMHKITVNGTVTI